MPYRGYHFHLGLHQKYFSLLANTHPSNIVNRRLHFLPFCCHCSLSVRNRTWEYFVIPSHQPGFHHRYGSSIRENLRTRRRGRNLDGYPGVNRWRDDMKQKNPLWKHCFDNEAQIVFKKRHLRCCVWELLQILFWLKRFSLYVGIIQQL